MNRRAPSTTPLPGLLLLAALLSVPAGSRQAAPSGSVDAVVQRSISVTFDYDFGKNPSCAEKPALKNCVKQFVVYDSSVRRAEIFTIPVPQGAHGVVKGITGRSPRRAFLPGRHRIAVTAQNAAGDESPVSAATFIVDVKSDRESPAAPAR